MSYGCEFGCGPDTPEQAAQYVGGPGFSLVPACPVHGWVTELLDSREQQADRLREALTRLGSLESFTGAFDATHAPPWVLWDELRVRGEYAVSALGLSVAGRDAPLKVTPEHVGVPVRIARPGFIPAGREGGS